MLKKCFEWYRCCFDPSISHETVYFCVLLSMSVYMWSGPGKQTQHRDDEQLSYFECERECVHVFVCRLVYLFVYGIL